MEVSNFLLSILLNNFRERALLYIMIVTVFNFLVCLSNGISIHTRQCKWKMNEYEYGPLVK